MTVRGRSILYWIVFSIILGAGIGLALIITAALFPAMDFGLRLLSPGISSTAGNRAAGIELVQSLISSANILNTLRVLTASIATYIVTLVLNILFIKYFRRVSASHLMFFFLFLFAVSAELLKSFNLVMNYFDVSSAVLIFSSRLSLLMYISGILSGFTASLYLMGLKYQHQGTAMFIIFSVAMVIAFILPMNTSSLNSNYLFETSYSRQLLWFSSGLLTLTLLGHLSQLLERYSREELLRALFSIMILSGYSLLYFGTNLLFSVIGGGILVGGLILYFIRLFYDYFWY